jgi:hypothetical protein
MGPELCSSSGVAAVLRQCPEPEHMRVAPWCLLLQVFCVTGSAPQEEMRQACFDYLALGGACASGPVSLLSGLNPSPSLLVMHFFSVALFGVQRLIKPRPTFR